MRNDIITRIETTLTPDGQGGWTEETIETGSFDVKLSIGANVEEATAYGVSVEQILKVIADVPLLEDEASLYIIQGPAGPQGVPGAVDFDALTPEQKEELKGDKGDKGDDGEPGKDGFTPSIAAQEVEDGVELTITNASGVSSALVKNGKDGDKGDSYTITQADYDAIANTVLSKMTNAEGVKY